MKKSMKLLFLVFAGVACLVLANGNKAMASTQWFEVANPGAPNIAFSMVMGGSYDWTPYSLMMDDGTDIQPLFTYLQYSTVTQGGYAFLTAVDPTDTFSFYLQGNGNELIATANNVIEGTSDWLLHFIAIDGEGASHLADVTVTNVAAVPLPATALLFGTGLLGLVGIGSRRNRNSRRG